MRSLLHSIRDLFADDWHRGRANSRVVNCEVASGRSKTALLGLIVLCAAGCVTDSKPPNFSVISVDLGQPTDIVGDGGPSREYIVVKLAADADMAQYARGRELNIGADASPCLNGSFDASRPLQNSPYLFDRVGKVDAFRKQSENSRATSAGDEIYRVYVAAKAIPLKGQNTYLYDLREHPSEICLRIRGGSMTGNTVVFDALVISQSMVVQALHEGRKAP